MVEDAFTNTIGSPHVSFHESYHVMPEVDCMTIGKLKTWGETYLTSTVDCLINWIRVIFRPDEEFPVGLKGRNMARETDLGESTVK